MILPKDIADIGLREQGLRERGRKAAGHPDSGQCAPFLSELDLEPSGGMGRARVSLAQCGRGGGGKAGPSLSG